jgi:hypothetical protein
VSAMAKDTMAPNLATVPHSVFTFSVEYPKVGRNILADVGVSKR